MVPELPAEVWIIVISYLCQAPPRPTGNNERSSIRQPFWPALMRVNKLFNRCTAHHLYSTIITDNLPSLIHNLGLPTAAAGIDSKLQLLGYMKRLFIEYGQKEHEGYEGLFRYDNKFTFVGADQSDLDALCKADSDGIASAGNALSQVTGVALRTFSTGAFLSGQYEIWTAALMSQSSDRSVVLSANSAEHSIHTTTVALSPAQSCHRAMEGPLMMAVQNRLPPVLPRQHSVHFQLETMALDGSVLLGHPVTPSHLRPSRWYFPPCSMKNDPKKVARLLMTLRSQTLRMVQVRETNIARSPECAKDSSLSVEMYIPSSIIQPEILTVITTSREIDFFTEMTKNNIPKSRFADDKWVYKKIEEAPECEACGWCTDDLW